MAKITSGLTYRKAINVISLSTKNCFGSTLPRNDKQKCSTLRRNRYSVAVIPNEDGISNIKYQVSSIENPAIPIYMTEEDGENT